MLRGAEHIEIVDHLDLTELLEQLSFVGQDAPLQSNVRSITVRLCPLSAIEHLLFAGQDEPMQSHGRSTDPLQRRDLIRNKQL